MKIAYFKICKQWREVMILIGTCQTQEQADARLSHEVGLIAVPVYVNNA